MLFMILVFIGFTIFIFKLYLKQSVYKNYKKTIGVCVDWDKYVKFENGEKSYNISEANYRHIEGFYRLPIVVYKVDGREYQITGRVGYGVSIFRLKGRKFKVRYNPENPQEAVISDEAAVYLFVSLLFGFVALMMLFNLITIIKEASYNNKHPDYEYTLFCTIDGDEYAIAEKFIAKTDLEVLERIKNSVKYKWCENPRVKIKK